MIVAVLAALTPAASWQGPETGRIEGVATISARLTSTRMRVRVYSEPGQSAPAAAVDSNIFGNVVMYLESSPALRRGAPTGAAPVMRQAGERFVPHVLAVSAGSTVEFPNDDPIYHNVFSLSRARTFDLGRYPRGTTKSVRFDRPGVVQVFCHLHADMRGFVLVLDNPFFVTPDPRGRFVLSGVPPGDYQLVVWHERIRPLVLPVTIRAGAATAMSVRIPLPDSVDTR
jgi:plastocyanin